MRKRVLPLIIACMMTSLVIVTWTLTLAHQPTIDSSLIAFDRESYGNQALTGLYVMSPDGAHVCRIAGAGTSEVAWSPDGQRIAYQDASVIPLDTVIIVRDLASGEQTMPGGGMRPAWLPDSQHIVMPDQSGENNQLSVIDIATAHSVALPFQRVVYGAAWPPDGTQIAFTEYVNDAHHIFIMNRDGTHLRVVRQPTAQELVYSIAWSPDGTQLAFTVQPSFEDFQHSYLSIMNADGTQDRILTVPPDGSKDDHATWSPDGHSIAFSRTAYVGNDDLVGSSQLYSVPTDNGAQLHQLSHSSQFNDTQPAWSPSNVRLVCSDPG